MNFINITRKKDIKKENLISEATEKVRNFIRMKNLIFLFPTKVYKKF